MPNLAVERINLRAPTEAKQIIEQAATLSATSVSAFILEHAYQAAKQLISEHERIVLSNAERDKFLAVLDNPPSPNAAMRELLELGEQLVSH
ncbi:MAG: DUF1778 domain-containing protein [Moraxellaceae bacterium]|nr:DUF1778 domain-containing protein [Pseudomonadales bacterium]MCP5173983.1 DUF1778 domain-containing protein [Moraxellaceae bacterium]HQV22944.1 DUF1778 domain-containing protein [Agitococcus sp.]